MISLELYDTSRYISAFLSYEVLTKEVLKKKESVAQRGQKELGGKYHNT